MEYSKYDDIAAMLFELCSFNQDEEILLIETKINGSQHPDFEKDYTSMVKHLYISHLKSIQNKTYTKIPYTQMHDKILSLIGKKQKDSSSDPNKTSTTEALLNKIKKIKKDQ